MAGWCIRAITFSAAQSALVEGGYPERLHRLRPDQIRSITRVDLDGITPFGGPAEAGFFLFSPAATVLT